MQHRLILKFEELSAELGPDPPVLSARKQWMVSSFMWLDRSSDGDGSHSPSLVASRSSAADIALTPDGQPCRSTERLKSFTMVDPPWL